MRITYFILVCICWGSKLFQLLCFIILTTVAIYANAQIYNKLKLVSNFLTESLCLLYIKLFINNSVYFSSTDLFCPTPRDSGCRIQSGMHKVIERSHFIQLSPVLMLAGVWYLITADCLNCITVQCAPKCAVHGVFFSQKRL